MISRGVLACTIGTREDFTRADFTPNGAQTYFGKVVLVLPDEIED